MSVAEIQAIDAACNLFTPEIVRARPSWTQDFIGRKVNAQDKLRGIPVAEMLQMMDRAQIRKALLIAVKMGPRGFPTSYELPYEEVARVVEMYPDRFAALAGINPLDGMNGVRELERAVRELGFIGAHVYPHWFELPPDDRKYYPFYTKCIELDIPMQMQVGHCLRYSAERPLRSVGRPICLDTIACDLPELKLVGSHIGFPWVDEMISVAWKHPNVYIASDAYAPKYWSESFVHFINSWGSDKVLFGTDFPVIDIERARNEVEDLGLRDDARRKFLSANAEDLYRV